MCSIMLTMSMLLKVVPHVQRGGFNVSAAQNGATNAT